MKTLSAIRTTVRQFLRDEFESSADYDFQDDELDLHIDACKVEISERRPYEVKEELTTVASKDLPISSIEDLLEVDKAEFPVGSDPPDYRNVSVFGSTLTIDIDTKPTAGQTIYLYCLKVHQLTEESSTLSPDLEKLLIDGATALTALGWINQVRVQVKAAVASIAEVNTAIDTMSARITQAMADLTTGRPLIGKVNIGGKPQADYAAFAARELGNANSYLSQSQGYLRELGSRLSITGAINAYQTWANNKLVLYQRELGRLARARTYTEYPKS
ncbi:hypothetical protein ES703_51882 [subsurface metagenome]